MTKVKICGITTLDDALAACEAGADALGFIFAPEAQKTGRYIAPDEARRIVEQLPPFVSTVAVCVNEPTERLFEYLSFMSWLQLHGEESPEQCEDVAPRAVKVFRVSPEFRVDSMSAYTTAGYLLDAWAPDKRGGTGKTCDWDVARDAARVAASLSKPLILAGGLTPENVADAVRTVKPYAVDTAGGVEKAPGKKDHAKIREFIRNAKQAV